MRILDFNLKETLKELNRPLVKHPIMIICTCIIATLFLYIFVDIVLSEIVRHNSFNIQMLVVELLNETGPEYSERSKEYEEILHLYMGHLNNRAHNQLLNFLYPEHNYEKVLYSCLQALENASDNEEAKNAIFQAGVVSNKFIDSIESRFPKSPYEWLKSEKIPNALLDTLEESMHESNKLVHKFVKNRTIHNAVTACNANRKTILYLGLARLGYNHKENIDQYLCDVKMSHSHFLELSLMDENNKYKNFLLQWADSERRRINILNAMLDNDMNKVSKLLREAIEKSFKEKYGLRCR